MDIRAYSQKELREQEEAQRQREIRALENQIQALEVRISEYRDLSLLGVEVIQMKYGKGVVIAQQDENITVQFENNRAGYIINKKYPMRPRFEDDEAIVNAYTEFAELKKQKESLEKELQRL